MFRKSLYLRLTRQQHPFEISIPTQMQVSRHFINKYFHHDKSPQQNQLPLNYHLKNHLSCHNSSDFNHLQAILYPLVAIVILTPLLTILKLPIFLAQLQFLVISFLTQPTQDVLFLILGLFLSFFHFQP